MWHKVLIASAFIGLLDKGNAQSCTGTNGKTCIFPFVHKGRKFNGCTKFTNSVGEHGWCSTKVKIGGEHIEGNYAYCPSSCPQDRPDTQEYIRRSFVKEACKVNRGKDKGVCVPSKNCKTVSSPKKGSCSEESHVCCYYEKPEAATDGKVKAYLQKTSGLKKARTNYGTSFHGGFNLPKSGAYEVDLAARKFQETANRLGNEIGLSTSSSSIATHNLRYYNAETLPELREACPWFYDKDTDFKKVYECSETNRPKYRPVDGTCNLLSAPHLGASFTPFQRINDAKYGPNSYLLYNDTQSKQVRLNIGLRVARDGKDLPNARLLSTRLSKSTAETHPTSPIMSVYVMQMGQFLDHDFAHSPNNVADNCCDPNPRKRDKECIEIEVFANDTYFGNRNLDIPDNRRNCMQLARAMTSPGINCELDSERQQMNQITHWIDASNVYGSSKDELKMLRSGRDGLLRTADIDDKMLPKCNENPSMEKHLEACHGPCDHVRGQFPSKGHCFGAGDFRINEHHGLTSIHTIWMREHNRVAKELKRANRWTDDEKIFNEARRIVIAEYQHITYNEWLPIILGEAYMQQFGIKTLSSGYSNAYFGEGARPEQFDPRVTNEFAAAAFRFGHSLIPPKFHVPFRRRGDQVKGYELRTAFFNPTEFRTDQGLNGDKNLVNNVLKEFAEQEGENWDNVFAEDILNHLMEQQDPETGKQKPGTGMDLIAINIQRGRDHGIPGYNEMRETCGLGKATKFSEFGKEMLAENWRKLSDVYEHVDDVDLYAGGFLEQGGSNCGQGQSGFTKCGILGPVFRCIIGDTFMRLRYGDRYFYDLDQDKHKFTPTELQEIRKTSMAKVICDNTPVTQMQSEAFKTPNPKIPQRKLTSCRNISGMDLSQFRGLDF